MTMRCVSASAGKYNNFFRSNFTFRCYSYEKSNQNRFAHCKYLYGSFRCSPQEQPLLLRVRRTLDASNADMPWQLRYIGQPELGDKSRPTIVRSSIDIATSNTVVEFLTELGCKLDFEYVTRGYMFRKGRMKITVSKIFKVNQGKVPEGVPEMISQSYLVELSVLAPSGQDAIAEDMRIFAEQLRPLVQLEKIDYKRLVH